MKVLVLGPLGPPHVLAQVDAVLERGVEVHVGGDFPPEMSDSALRALGVDVTLAPEISRSSPRGIATTALWTRRLFRRVQPDVVHAHWVPGFGFAAVLARAKPLIITAWGSDIYRASSLMNRANRAALKSAGAVTADSADLLRECRRLGATKRTELIQWGVDLGRFTPVDERRRAALKDELGWGSGPVILSPRSLMPVYNIPVIVEAFEGLTEQFLDATLVLKHMGPVRIELGPLPERTVIAGHVEYDQMPHQYQAADVCVSVTSSDSSPRSIWEAMACGCPCVLSDLPWVHELITPGQHALTVPVGDAGAVRDAVATLLNDSELSARLAANARALVEEHLDQAKEMDRLVGLYESLAEEGPG